MQDKTKDFNSLITGAFNELSVLVAKEIVSSPGKFPIIYFSGGVGLGKSHLLNAIANEVTETQPDIRVVLTTARRLMKEMILAIQERNLPDFQAKYTRDTDILLIDDFEELENKTGTQGEFLNIINEMLSQKKQIVITGKDDPRSFKGFDEKIISRILGGGFAIKIQHPEADDLKVILKHKCKAAELDIQDESLSAISSRAKSLRDLEGIVLTLCVYRDFVGHGRANDIDDQTFEQLFGRGLDNGTTVNESPRGELLISTFMSEFLDRVESVTFK